MLPSERTLGPLGSNRRRTKVQMITDILKKVFGTSHEREIKRFLALSAINPGKYGMRGPLDELWHTFIIFTSAYANFCRLLGGGFIHHLPETPGLKVAARYRAAGAGLEVGGDWFAGFPLDNGRLGLIVGDMTGHGINAVADMAQVRAMTSALLRAGLSLEEVADQASQFVAESASAVATAMIAILDPGAGRLRGRRRGACDGQRDDEE